MNYELARQLIAEATLKKALMTGKVKPLSEATHYEDLLAWYKSTGANPPAEGMIPTYKNLKRMYKKAKAQQGKPREQKKRVNNALRSIGKKSSPLSEATRSKYLKAISKAGIFGDKTDRNNRELQRRAAILRRGGAEPRTIRNEISRIAAQNRGEWESQDPNVQMAGYRFANKSDFSRAAGKKSPRSPKHGVYESRHLSNLSRNKSVRKLKRVGKNIRNVGRKLYKALSTPQSSIDAMITGRNF